MNYQIKIVKTEPNPNYELELKEKSRTSRYGGFDVVVTPEKTIVTDVLTCELTEDQYKKVKLEVLKVFE